MRISLVESKLSSSRRLLTRILLGSLCSIYILQRDISKIPSQSPDFHIYSVLVQMSVHCVWRHRLVLGAILSTSSPLPFVKVFHMATSSMHLSSFVCVGGVVLTHSSR